MSDWDHLDERDVEAVSGCCLLIRADLLKSLGGFDEGFFMYGEDLDLCWRARAKGYRVRYIPSAEIVHYSESSSAQNASPMFIETFESMFKFFRKNRGGLQAAIYRGMTGGLSAAWIAAESAKAALARGERAAHIRDRVIPMYRSIVDWSIHGSMMGRNGR
jgi:GT2 family glycosyltransferase